MKVSELKKSFRVCEFIALYHVHFVIV